MERIEIEVCLSNFLSMVDKGKNKDKEEIRKKIIDGFYTTEHPLLLKLHEGSRR
jgi:hypothetical protein